jgi:hypothetical protein
MKRFLGTTAILVALSGTAMAETHSAAMGGVMADQTDFFASDLIGMRIYNTEARVEGETTVAAGAEAEWEDIGEINDIIITADGDVRAVILGVGGFLGMGERDVTVSMDDITILTEDGNPDERFLVVSTSKAELEQAPAFERNMDREMNDGETAMETSSTTTTATGDTQLIVENEAEELEQDVETAATDAERAIDSTAMETEQAMENAEAETEQVLENAEAETEQVLENAEAETAEALENVETGTEQVIAEGAAEIDEETRELARDDTMLSRPAVEREGYAEVEMAEFQQLTADMLEGSYVYGVNDETVGEIDALILDDNGQVSEVVVNVGGFLGLGEKPVAVSFDELQILRNQTGDDLRVYIDATEEGLEAKPEYQD